MTKSRNVKITPAKGRPMLTWVGKRPLSALPALPAQHVETFDPTGDFGLKKIPEQWRDWPGDYPKGGLLFHGDNKEVLAHLLANGFRGKVNLIYIDPPFDSGADYIRKPQLRGAQSSIKIEGEYYSLGEQIQYTDIWANDNYLQFMFERLLLLKELLSDYGVIFLHCNHEKVHLLRCLMDEVFGADNFRNDIIWKRGPGKSHPKYFGRIKDTILFYCKGSDYTWNKQYYEISENYKKTFTKKDKKGYYVTQPLHSGKPAKNVPKWKGVKPPEGRGWAYKIETLDIFDKEGQIEWSDDGVPRLKRYLDEIQGTAIQDVWEDIVDSASPQFLQAFYNYLEDMNPPFQFDIWDDINPVLDRSFDHTGYPTQKPVALAERMIKACTKKGDIILDCFAGSSPALVAAQKLGRRWIGCDINKGAIQTTSKRLQNVISEQTKSFNQPRQMTIGGGEEKENQTVEPAQLGFTVWRVNDYDLQIQHNEAVNLACEYIGVERKRSDAYFEGTRGKSLVKIIPFTHPLSPLDLEELRRELKARPDEDRDIEVICLGMELSAQAWVEDWNRHRSKGVPNRIHVIELKTDPKYAGFIQHDPATAKVSIRREKNSIKVKIIDMLGEEVLVVETV